MQRPPSKPRTRLAMRARKGDLARGGARRWTGLWPWALVALGGAFACRAGLEPSPPTVGLGPPVTSAATSSAASASAGASTSAGAGASARAGASAEAGASAAAPSATTATAAVVLRDPGPGQFVCGDTLCKAGADVCAPKTACGPDWPAKGCVPVAELAARNFVAGATGTECESDFSWHDRKTCDGPGDCGQGEVCCYARDRIIGPGNDGDDGFLDEWACKPARRGATPCDTHEICSAADSKCGRKGSTCVIDLATGAGTCEVPRRGAPRCESAPCPAGLVCAAFAQGVRQCVGSPAAGETDGVECQRGMDCAPDESCFALRHRCALSAESWVGDDRALCVDATDCVTYCGGDKSVAHCQTEPGEPSGVCECRPRCKRDQDCAGDIDCGLLGLERAGMLTMLTTPFCDAASGRCDCR